MIHPNKLDRPPAGFAACPECAYRKGGSAPICFACSSESTEAVASRACSICALPVGPDGVCGNPLCSWTDRYFETVSAVSMRTGSMRHAITRYKYDGKWGWAAIFGRILVGYLDEFADAFSAYDLIIPSPTYMGPGGTRTFDHIEKIVKAAEIEEPLKWPFAYGVVVKAAATERFAGKRWIDRKAIAEGALRSALSVPDPSRVAGKKVLVFDDVFTEGFTIREVARVLIHAGAIEVSEVVLAREPWKG